MKIKPSKVLRAEGEMVVFGWTLGSCFSSKRQKLTKGVGTRSCFFFLEVAAFG